MNNDIFEVIHVATGTLIDGPFRSLDGAAQMADLMNRRAGKPLYVALARDGAQSHLQRWGAPAFPVQS